MEKYTNKTYEDIVRHLDQLIEQSAVKVEEATEEVTESFEKKERKHKKTDESQTMCFFKWQEAYLLVMLLKKEIIITEKDIKSKRDRDYLNRLNSLLDKLNECHYTGLAKWFKTIESDDPKEKNMFHLFSYDNDK